MDLVLTETEVCRYAPTELLRHPERSTLLMRSADQINALCFGRLTAADPTPFQKETVQKALCLHAAFLLSYGDVVDSPLQSYGINGVSMAFDSSRVVIQGGVTTSREVYSLLLMTGFARRYV